MAQPNFMLLWISTKADDSTTYGQVTGVSPKAYERVLEHIEAVGRARLKRRTLATMDGSDAGQHPFCKFCATPQANEVLEQMINALTEYPDAQFRKVFRPGYAPAA